METVSPSFQAACQRPRITTTVPRNDKIKKGKRGPVREHGLGSQKRPVGGRVSPSLSISKPFKASKSLQASPSIRKAVCPKKTIRWHPSVPPVAPVSAVVPPAIPGTQRSEDTIVPCESHPLNAGKTSGFIGKRGKRYHRHDIITPIVDSMRMMYARMGWCRSLPDDDEVLDSRFPTWVRPNSLLPKPTNFAAAATAFTAATAGASDTFHPTPTAPFANPNVCHGCNRECGRNDLMPTADKSHLVCKHCGVVASSLCIATNRERNCSADEDKTTHADKPYERNADPFSHPAMSAAERRRQVEISVSGTRISKRAKEKHHIGFSQEHANRKAANEELIAQRGDMSAKDFNKGNQILVELEKRFVPLDPMDANVKRFCRREAARLWEQGCRHSKVCCAGGTCQYRIKDRSVAVLAEVLLQCTLENLSQGTSKLERVEPGHVLTLITKLRSQCQHASVSCGYRAVEQIIRRLLAHDGSEPLPACPLREELSSPAVSAISVSSGKSGRSAPSTPQTGGSSSLVTAVLAPKPLPVRHQTSSSDLEDTVDLLRLRDAISKMCRHTSRASNIQRAALKAIQQSNIRANVRDTALTTNEVAFCIVDAVNVKLSGTGVPTSCRPTKIKANRVDGEIHKIFHLLPELAEEDPAEEDGLF